MSTELKNAVSGHMIVSVEWITWTAAMSASEWCWRQWGLVVVLQTWWYAGGGWEDVAYTQHRYKCKPGKKKYWSTDVTKIRIKSWDTSRWGTEKMFPGRLWVYINVEEQIV